MEISDFYERNLKSSTWKPMDELHTESRPSEDALPRPLEWSQTDWWTTNDELHGKEAENSGQSRIFDDTNAQKVEKDERSSEKEDKETESNGKKNRHENPS